jgi:diguanylate cyclase (GGDEF)-like protein/PAS domain S-box-containing protein
MNSPWGPASHRLPVPAWAAASGRLALLVDVADEARVALDEAGGGAGWRFHHTGGGASLREALERCACDAVVLDGRLPAAELEACCRLVRHYWPQVPLLLHGAAAATADDAAVGAASGLLRIASADPQALLAALAGAKPAAAAATAPHPIAGNGIGPVSRLEQLADNIPECLWLYDLAQRGLVYVNPAYAQITGHADAASRLGADWRSLFDCVDVEDVARFAEAQARAPFGGLDEELRIRRRDGELRWIQLRTFAIRDRSGLIAGIGGVIRDVSALIEQRAQLHRVTHYDGLTALPNRLLLLERLRGSLAMARRSGWRVGLLLIDLDRFKLINDTLGHLAGDELLRQAALRLRACLRESDTVGRLGGDEFAVVLPDMDSNELAAVVARKIVEVTAEPFVVDGRQLFVSASVGISLFPDDGDGPEALIRNAEAAMYQAKEGGRNGYLFYAAEMNARAQRRLGLETDLRQALVRGEFELHYQPKVDCRSGRIAGVEALIRWRHPQRGLVGPGEFIPLLEETGLIVAVGDWVLNAACTQMKCWHDAGFTGLDVAVNVSARQMDGGRLAGQVRAALAASGLPPTALELELTESLLMRDPPAAADMLVELKAIGVQVAVDDFGTGYSSLSYLKRFPLDNLKVDRAFVQDIAASAGDASITRAVIRMGHELALKVVAEGVETAEQLAALQAAGCDEIQGYLFSRPLPAPEIGALLASGRGLPPAPQAAGTAAAAGHDPALARALAEFGRERERLSQAAAAARDLWRQTIDALGLPLIGVDLGGRIAFLNRAAEAELGSRGVRPGEPLAQCLGELSLPPENALPTTIDYRQGARRWRLGIAALTTTEASGGWLLSFHPAEAQ